MAQARDLISIGIGRGSSATLVGVRRRTSVSAGVSIRGLLRGCGDGLTKLESVTHRAEDLDQVVDLFIRVRGGDLDPEPTSSFGTSG